MEITEFQEKTDLKEYLKDSINFDIINSISKWRTILYEEPNDNKIEENALRFLNIIHGDFNIFVRNINNPGVIEDIFSTFDYSVRFISCLIHFYEIELTTLGEKSLDVITKICEIRDYELFSTKYSDNKINIIIDQFTDYTSQLDSKQKLKQLITFRSKVMLMQFRNPHSITHSTIVKNLDNAIQSLEKLNSLSILDMNEFDKTHKFKLASQKKTDFIKIISAMYDTRMFENTKGYKATNKQDILNEFGKMLNEDFSSYSTILSQSKKVDEVAFMKPFSDIQKKAKEYYDKELVK